MGPLEITLLLLFSAFALVGTIWGIVDAAQRSQTGWLIGIIVGWLVGLGWLIGWIYLLAIRPGLARQSS